MPLVGGTASIAAADGLRSRCSCGTLRIVHRARDRCEQGNRALGQVNAISMWVPVFHHQSVWYGNQGMQGPPLSATCPRDVTSGNGVSSMMGNAGLFGQALASCQSVHS